MDAHRGCRLGRPGCRLDVHGVACLSGRAAHHGMLPRKASTSSITTPMRLSLYLAAKL